MTHDQIQQLIPPTRDMDAYQESWVTLLESQLETEEQARALLRTLEHRNVYSKRTDKQRNDPLADIEAEQTDSLSFNLRCLLEQLPVEQKHLLSWLYLDGISRKEAAQRLGISQPTLRRKHDEAIQAVKKIAPSFHF